GKNPIRVVIDKHLTLDNNLSLFDKSQPTICYNLIKNEIEENLDFVQLRENFTIKDILDDLYRRKVQSLIVEGGSYLLQRFISEELWDEARVFNGQGKFHHGISAPLLNREL